MDDPMINSRANGRAKDSNGNNPVPLLAIINDPNNRSFQNQLLSHRDIVILNQL